MFPRSSFLQVASAVSIFQQHLADISALVVALVMCSSVLAAAIFMLLLRPSPRHRLIVDLWAWADHEETHPPLESHLAA